MKKKGNQGCSTRILASARQGREAVTEVRNRLVARNQSSALPVLGLN